MEHQLRSRNYCMDIVRKYSHIDPWFAYYALEQLCISAQINELNDLAEALVALVEYPVAIGNDRVERLVRERFGE